MPYVSKSYLKEISITNYRNYKSFLSSFTSGVHLFYGENGCGKTNILEAISLLSYGKSLRGASLEDIIYRGEKFAEVRSCIVTSDLGELSLDVKINFDNEIDTFKKTYYLDNNILKITNRNYFLDTIHLIPQMDNFFIQDNSFKRKFIDKLICIVDKNHTNRLNEHEKLIKERNKLLYNYRISSGNSKNIWLNKVEEQIAPLSASIVASRLDFINNLSTTLEQNEIHSSVLYMEGKIEDLFKEHKHSLSVEKEIIKLLHNLREHDSYKLTTSVGAHKSRLIAKSLLKNSNASVCSTGEQKIILVNTILAFYKLFILFKNISPVLLLDEINVHLDNNVLNAVMKDFLSLDTQIFITSTNKEIYKNFSEEICFFDLKKL